MQKIFVLPRSVFRWITLFAWVCLGLVATPVQAQTYAYRNDTFAYDTPSGSATTVTWHAGTDATWLGSPACTSYPNGDDDWADVTFPSGFTFTFGGVSYSSVRVYSNGMLAFPPDVSGFHRDYGPQALPITTAGTPGPQGNCSLSAVPKNLMVLYWVDIVAGSARGVTGDSVKYELLGTAPNRRFVVSFNNVALYSGTSTRYSFQVALYESSSGVNGNFRYQYTTGASDGSGATVGVQLTTADVTQYSYDQQFIDTTNGTAILWYPANQLASKAAEYRFDEALWAGAAGEIKDTSGNSKNASRVGSATSVPYNTFPGGKLCRGGSFTNNTSNATIDAVATPLVPSNQGSIDFWFNSNVKWNTSAAMLFDATTVANRPFYLMKSASGALTFAVSDSVGTVVKATAPAQSYALNTWHHIGVSWNVRVGTNQTVLQIFLDGVLQNGAATRGTTNGFLPSLSSIYIGDNRTSGVTPSGGTPNGANGSIDEFYIYSVELSAPQVVADMNLTRSNCTSLDHFHIIHDGTVSSCTAPAQITIEAHDATHGLFSLAGTTVNLSTSPAHGTWSDVGGAISVLSAIGAGTGTASYTFSNESKVTFGLSDNVTESLNIDVVSGSITEHTGTAATCVPSDYTNASVTTCDDSRSFKCAAPFGFNCVESGEDALTGHLYTKLAGTPFSFHVVALKDSDGNGVADAVDTSYASGVNKNVTVELVDGAAANCVDRMVLSPEVKQTLTFVSGDSGRKATADMTSTKAHPNLYCRVTDANQTPSIVRCSTDNFAVRPSAVTIGTSATAAAPTATATPMVKAGANFTLQATTSAGTNYGGTLTLDTAKLSAQTTAQASTQASGGTVGALTPSTLTTNPATLPTNNATYSEVGYLYLAAGAFRDDTYTAVDSAVGDCVTVAAAALANTPGAELSDVLASGKYGCSVGNKATVSLGRFVPDHFDTAIVQATAPISCPASLTCPNNSSGANGLLYASQPFSLQATAKNASGNATTNYQGVFAKANTLSAWSAAGGTTSNPGGGAMANTTLASAAFSAGVGSSATPTYTLGTVTTAPTDVFFRTSDADAVTSLRVSGSVEAGLQVASGRILVPNVYGSERLSMPITTTVQYYSSTSWVTSLTDSATEFNSALTTAIPIPGNVLLTAASGLGSPVGSAVSVISPSSAVVTNGVRTFSLAAPMTPGHVNISINSPIYLPSTNGLATFGVFRSPLIYRRENY